MSDSPWRDLGVRTASGVVLAAMGLASIWLGGAVWALSISLLALIMVSEWLGLCRGSGVWSWAAGVVYIGPACLALLWLRAGAGGLHRVLFLAAVVWAGDIGAYLVGRLVGGPRLAPSISPGKTWSGALGGTLCAVLAAVVGASGHPGPALLAGLVLSVAAQAGDLLESAIKRRFGAKDSGNIIPGHGGVLDRLDGVLTAAPLAALWSLAIGPEKSLGW